MFQRCFLCTNNNKAERAKYIYDIMYKCYKRCRFAWALLLHRTAQHTNHRAMRMNKHVWVLNNLGDKKTLYRFLLACRCTLWLTLVKHRFYARSAIPINLRFKLATLATGRHTSFFSLLFLMRAVLNDYITIKNNGNHSMRIKKPEIEFRKADSTPLWRVPINTTTAGCYIDRLFGLLLLLLVASPYFLEFCCLTCANQSVSFGMEHKRRARTILFPEESRKKTKLIINTHSQ